MKKSILFTIIFVLFSLLGFTQKTNTQNNDIFYRDLGSFHQEYNDGSIIHVDAYIVKRLNNSGIYSEYKYQYLLTLKSKSVHNGYYTQTWLYNSKIYYNGNEISYTQYPNGMTLYISTAPTAVYSWYTNEEEIAKFIINWNSSAYEPRVK